MSEAPSASHANAKTVLLVEDNEDDIFLMRRLFKKEAIEVPLQVVTDGKQALEYLSGTGPYRDRSRHPLPGFLFLDLKFPYLQGFEILAWIRDQPHLNGIPVAILTSSVEDRDRGRAAEFGVSYLVKPPTPEMVAEALRFLA
ncbi:Response regulator receiver domain-containing protein [Verrucomicrobium sp. GAS474]|uniref:response regulator n=1 Tax=Verrucomicrobium sp. GAS474 TaxID=1882831 RepID=UPI00087BC907|nr:response regulator [Verrucomicrobium sp. GAS474]SDU03232.1 Response regulator receiver domain-containing protein [Verrucomicrobium sp. GAS474]